MNTEPALRAEQPSWEQLAGPSGSQIRSVLVKLFNISNSADVNISLHVCGLWQAFTGLALLEGSFTWNTIEGYSLV